MVSVTQAVESLTTTDAKLNSIAVDKPSETTFDTLRETLCMWWPSALTRTRPYLANLRPPLPHRP
jgi:hypothetical protein